MHRQNLPMRWFIILYRSKLFNENKRSLAISVPKAFQYNLQNQIIVKKFTLKMIQELTRTR